jgi:endonuclease/exonuclease/phosphatase family metal-dependent hydrolase
MTGNLIASRLPVRQVFRHLLPFPVDPGVNGMPRLALEAAIVAPFGEVRVITTHLGGIGVQRTAQVEALRAIYAEGRAHAERGSITDTTGGSFHTHLRPAPTIITGDFNLEPVDPLHARMKAPFAEGTVPLVDAWETLHPGVAHPSTFCIYMKMEPGRSSFIAFLLRQRGPATATQVDSHRPGKPGIGSSAGNP